MKVLEVIVGNGGSSGRQPFSSMYDDFVKNERYTQGWTAVPRHLVDMVKEGWLSKSGYNLLTLLFHYHSLYQMKPDEWFFKTNKAIVDTGLMSENTLLKARKELIDKGFIDYQKGNSFQVKAGQYRLKTDPKYFQHKTVGSSGTQIQFLSDEEA